MRVGQDDVSPRRYAKGKLWPVAKLVASLPPTGWLSVRVRTPQEGRAVAERVTFMLRDRGIGARYKLRDGVVYLGRNRDRDGRVAPSRRRKDGR